MTNKKHLVQLDMAETDDGFWQTPSISKSYLTKYGRFPRVRRRIVCEIESKPDYFYISHAVVMILGME